MPSRVRIVNPGFAFYPGICESTCGPGLNFWHARVQSKTIFAPPGAAHPVLAVYLALPCAVRLDGPLVRAPLAAHKRRLLYLSPPWGLSEGCSRKCSTLAPPWIKFQPTHWGGISPGATPQARGPIQVRMGGRGLPQFATS